MKRVFQRWAGSITARLFLVFLLAWSAFSAMVFVVLRMANERLADNIMQGQAERVSYYSAIVNADLNRITELLFRLSADEDVSDFMHRREEDRKFNFQDYLSYQRSMEKLKGYLSSSMYIDDVFLVIRGTGEMLSANSSVISMPDAFREPVALAEEAENELFFAVDDTMVYLNRGAGGMIVGIEVSVRHIKSMLNALNPGYFDCFLVDGETGELLGRSLTAKTASRVYEEIAFPQASAGRTGEDRTDAGQDEDGLPDGFVRKGTGGITFRKNSGSVTADGEEYLYEAVQTFGNHFILCFFAGEEQVNADLHQMGILWGFLTVLVFLMPVVIGLALHRILRAPMRRLILGMKAVEEENYAVRLPETGSTEFNYVFHEFNDMTSRIETLIREVYENRLQAEQAKRRQLQAQINPHFLFNSFYMGYRMAKSGETEKVADLCMLLGDYFKILTYVSDREITLRQEMKFVDTYLRLNEMRFSSKLSYRIRMEEGMEDRKIIPLLVQPIVENAIRHGVERVSTPCEIRIDVSSGEGCIRVRVADNSGQTDAGTVKRLEELIRRPGYPEENVGLWNVEKRLRLLGNGSCGLVFERPDERWFQVSFCFPEGEAAPHDPQFAGHRELPLSGGMGDRL